MAERFLDARRILVVEDEYFLARDVAGCLRDAGAKVVGPVASLADAMWLLENAPLDGAVIDINLGGEPVYPLADALALRQVPFVFLTGYDRASIPKRWAATVLIEKPAEMGVIVAAIGREVGDGGGPKIRMTSCLPS